MIGLTRRAVAVHRGYAIRWVPATILAGILAVFRLAERPLTYDERVTARLATTDWDRFADRVLLGDQLFGVLYYVLIRAWSVLGADAFVLRLPSVVFAVATVPVTYFIARRLFGPRVATVTALILAAHPLFIRYAQEARAYALALLLITLATLLLMRAMERPTHRRWAAYAAAAIGAGIAHAFAVLVILVHLGLLLARRPMHPAGLGAAIAVLAVVVPFGVTIAVSGPERDFIPEMRMAWVRTVGDRLAGGFGIWPPVHALAYAAFAGLAMAAWWRRSPILVCVAWVAIPVAIAAGISLVKPIFLPRYLIVVLPALVMLVAVGVESVRPRDARIPALLVVLVLAATHLGPWYAGGPDL